MTGMTRGACRASSHQQLPMAYKLKPALSYCVIDERCYFLDLDDNRYFAFSGELNSFFLACARDACLSVDERIAQELERRTLLTRGEAPTQISPFQVAAPNVVVEPSCGSLYLAVRAVHAYLLAVRCIKTAALRGASGLLRREQLRRVSRPHSLIDIAAGISRAKRWLGAHDRCLQWSVATALLLLRNGYQAKVVLGVCAKPFTAHCWVQVEEVLVSDSLERVAMFTPVAAL